MLLLLLSIVIGLAVGYFATQNTSAVTIQFGEYVVENLPLYAVAVGSLMIGVLIAWIIYAARAISNLTVASESHGSRWSRRTIADLNQRIQALEAENSRLRIELTSTSNYSAPAEGHRESIHSDEETRRPVRHVSSF